MHAMLNEFESKMKKTLEVFSSEMASIRAGRANPAVLDKLTVDYYGAPTLISQLASVSVVEARTLAIQPWDSSVLKLIEKAIQTSDIGINPQNDGKVIRLVFPPLTEERRKDLVKGLRKTAEEAKVSVRNIRRDAVDKAKAAQKKSEITEDDLSKIEKDIQALTDKYVKEVDNVAAAKEAEVMTV
ncbi:MAG: ribosome recycling factor [Clostridia bacterium]|nr:ribosome recycling factor [Clostridia bacterium]